MLDRISLKDKAAVLSGATLNSGRSVASMAAAQVAVRGCRHE